MKQEFYIGWENQAAPGIGQTIRLAVIVVLLVAVLAAAILAAAQRMIGIGAFEWGTTKSFSGILQTTPYPHLLVPRPGEVGSQTPYSAYYLVAPGKFGLPAAAIARFDGQSVTLKGTLIYRSDQTMIEVVDDSIKADAKHGTRPAGQETLSLGRQTLIGEIVDSKCFFGVMNPGQLAPHRACAIRCISGGVPPVLLVRPPQGAAIYILLVSADGRSINQQVLDFVAEPVRITGQLERQGGLLILRADPATYQKL